MTDETDRPDAEDLDAENCVDDHDGEDDHDVEDDSRDTAADLVLGGTELSDDELAALLAVIGRLAGSDAVNDRGQGTAGPTNRARYRRRRLGLHERHGADAWQFAAGVR